MIHKIIIPLYLEEVAPRFDLASEVFIATVSKDNTVENRKDMVLTRSSAEDLCHLILAENINTLICGAIENEYYQFLRWKKIIIFDAVSGTWADAFQHYLNGSLKTGDMFCKREIEGKHV